MENKSLSTKQITKYTKHLQKNKNNYYINSLSNNSIDKLTLNNEFTQTFDNTFSNIIDTDVKPTKQGKSGRCWLFAFTNLLRLHFIKKHNLDYNFQFSQNYLFFYDKLEKCQYFLQIMYKKKDKDITSQSIKYFFDKPITDGGFWNMACNLIKKYGIVPKTNMRDTFQSGNTKKLNFFLNMNLREFSFIIRKKNFTQDEFNKFLEKKMLIIYKILVFFLGTPPKTFTWNYYTKHKKEKKTIQNLTPKLFYKKFIDFNPDDYIILTNFPLKRFPYFRLYNMKYCNNMIDGDSADFVNLPINYIRNICKESINNNQPIWFGADIHHYFDKNKGIADLNIYNYDFLHKMNQNDFEKGERLLFNQSVPNHAMLILGYDIDKNNKIKKWYIENSWGRKNNKGFISMSDNWFDNFVFEVVVKKDCLNEKLMNKINFKKKTKIYPWKIISCEALSVV